MTKNYMLLRSRTLKKFWKRVTNDNAILQSMEGIESTDYYKNNLYEKSMIDYTMTIAKINRYLEELRCSISNQTTSGGEAYVTGQVQYAEISNIRLNFESSQDEQDLPATIHEDETLAES